MACQALGQEEEEEDVPSLTSPSRRESLLPASLFLSGARPSSAPLPHVLVKAHSFQTPGGHPVSGVSG